MNRLFRLLMNLAVGRLMSLHPDSPWQPQLTEDGSYTFFSEQFGEAFHSRQGARTEALEKFAQATHLLEQSQQGSVRLLDICYGLGYNTAAALDVIWQANPHCRVEVYGLELDPTVPIGAITPDLLQAWSPRVRSVLTALATQHQLQQDALNASLLIGDARQTLISLVKSGFQADAIFLDPFSVRRCPQLWTVEFLQQVAHCLAPLGVLATYARSAAVRSALLQAGLCIGTIPPTTAGPAHTWAEGTIAAWQATNLTPLSVMEQEHLKTRAAIPYQDPTLQGSAEEIHDRHHQAQKFSSLESTSSWRRRWGIDGGR